MHTEASLNRTYPVMAKRYVDNIINRIKRFICFIILQISSLK